MDPEELARQRRAEADRQEEEYARRIAELHAEADEANRQRKAEQAELDQQMWGMVNELRARNDAEGA